MPRKKKNPPNRTGKAVQVYMTDELRSAVDRAREETRRSLTAEICLAVEQHLERLGYWPPKSETSSDE